MWNFNDECWVWVWVTSVKFEWWMYMEFEWRLLNLNDYCWVWMTNVESEWRMHRCQLFRILRETKHFRLISRSPTFYRNLRHFVRKFVKQIEKRFYGFPVTKELDSNLGSLASLPRYKIINYVDLRFIYIYIYIYIYLYIYN